MMHGLAIPYTPTGRNHGRQGRPTSADWSLWQTFLKQGILGRGWRLKQPLGEWDHTADNVQLPQDYKSFTSELAAGLIIAVSDGSYFSQYGTAA
jgi:hypothetical protein